MKKNLYFRTVIRRQNHLVRGLLDFVFGWSSWPRLIIEVFIRKNFGERYFSLAAAIAVFIGLLIWPVIVYFKNVNGYTYTGWDYLLQYTTWYLLTGAFLYFSILRNKEVRRNPSTFDFGKCSEYTGDIARFFRRVKFNHKSFNRRQIEILLEPLMAFAAGFVLMLLSQSIGGVLMVLAVIYSLSYSHAYKQGDDFVLDKIDEMIYNEELENAFVHDKEPEDCRGVRFYMKKPDDRDLRSKLAEEMVYDDEPTFAL